MLFAILVVGCAKSQPAPEVVTLPSAGTSGAVPAASPTAPRVVLANPELRVIVAEGDATNFYFGGSLSPKFFTPTEGDVAAFETKLPAFLRANVRPSRRGNPPLADRVPKYLRQYVGVIDARGTRRIWGNFFCEYFGGSGDDAGWRREGFVVKDGGDCFFNVLFDPAAGSFEALRVNGDG